MFNNRYNLFKNFTKTLSLTTLILALFSVLIVQAEVKLFVSDEIGEKPANYATTTVQAEDLAGTWKSYFSNNSVCGIAQNSYSFTALPDSIIGQMIIDGKTINVSLQDMVDNKWGTPANTQFKIKYPSATNNGNDMEDDAPRPISQTGTDKGFAGETSGSTSSRNAALFSFEEPTTNFGVWFGDLESRTDGFGVPAIVRLFDASGNQIMDDYTIVPNIPANQSLCGSTDSTHYTVGCGNKTTRFIGFTTDDITPVSKMLVIVGDDDAIAPNSPNPVESIEATTGNTEHLSFIGATLLKKNSCPVSSSSSASTSSLTTAISTSETTVSTNTSSEVSTTTQTSALATSTTSHTSSCASTTSSSNNTCNCTPIYNPNVCWNHVITTLQGGQFYWKNTCKGDKPSCDMNCNDSLVSLDIPEVAEYLSWVNAGRPEIMGCIKTLTCSSSSSQTSNTTAVPSSSQASSSTTSLSSSTTTVSSSSLTTSNSTSASTTSMTSNSTPTSTSSSTSAPTSSNLSTSTSNSISTSAISSTSTSNSTVSSSTSSQAQTCNSTDLKIEKTHNGDFRRYSVNIYNLKVTNNGPMKAISPITIIDTLPYGMTFVGSTSSTFACSVTGNLVNCIANRDLAVGESLEVQISVQVNELAANPSVNVASVFCGCNDIDPKNNVATDKTTVLEPVPSGIGGMVCGLIFEDRNNNSIYDLGDVFIPGTKATLTDSNGSSFTAYSAENGMYCISNVAAGNANITIHRSTVNTSYACGSALQNTTSNEAQLVVSVNNNTVLAHSVGYYKNCSMPSSSSSSSSVSSVSSSTTSSAVSTMTSTSNTSNISSSISSSQLSTTATLSLSSSLSTSTQTGSVLGESVTSTSSNSSTKKSSQGEVLGESLANTGNEAPLLQLIHFIWK